MSDKITTAEHRERAKAYMSDGDRAFVEGPGFDPRSGATRAEHRLVDANRRRRADVEKKAFDRYGKAVFAEAQAERARLASEAKAAVELARSASYAAMSPLEREIEDRVREVHERHAAERLASPTRPTDRPKERPMDLPTLPDAPVTPMDADALATRARDAAGLAEREPTERNRAAALIAGTEAGKARALARLVAERRLADVAEAQVVASASDPMARERESARVRSNSAEPIGRAEVALLAAELDHDRAVCQVAAASKQAASRIESRKREMAADESRAESDPMRLGNAYYRAPTSLADWQFKALSPELQRKAVEDGCRIYSDPPCVFTKDDAANILRSRGTPGRQVLTRAELAALPGPDQAAAARSAIIVD